MENNTKSAPLKKLASMIGTESEETTEGDLLQEVFKNATSVLYSVEVIKPYATDRTFKNLLYALYNEFSEFKQKALKRAAEIEENLDETSIMAKVMMSSSVFFSTITDKSVSKLAQIMVQGLNMGVISVIKEINALESDEEIDVSLAKEELQMLERAVTEFKKYL